MTRMRSVTGNSAVALLVLLLWAVLTTPAAGANGKGRSQGPPVQAQFEGRQINLQRGWGDARTCVVWNDDGETDCFRTEQAADAAVQRRQRAEARAHAGVAGPVSATAPMGTGLDVEPRGTQPQMVSICSTWLYLYEHQGYGGRSLRFRDTRTTQDLATWGFASQTSSYRVGACPVALRDAGGAAYPGWTGPHATAWRMASGWDNRVRYLRIS